MSEKITYDPDKRYVWTPEDQFTFSGQEFGIVLNALRAVLSTQEAAKILLAERANTMVEKALARAVESGQVKEDVSEQTPQASALKSV